MSDSTPDNHDSTPHSTREVEHKFRVHGRFVLPRFDDIEGVGRVAHRGSVGLAATYFDTVDLRLVRDGVTLRRRTGGDDAGWHLKLPTKKAGVRDELRLPLDSGDGGTVPPLQLTGIVAVITRREPVTAVATLHTDRHTWAILGANDEPIADIVDDNVSVVAPDGTTTARLRELELEVAGASSELVGKVINRVTASGATEGRFLAKVARALGPRAAEPADVPPPPSLSEADPAGACVSAHLAKHARALRKHDMGFRRDPSRPGDHVHQMRVAARRLRSGLRVFRPLLDQEWATVLAGELRWAAHGLARLREAEVVLPRLASDVRHAIDDEQRADAALQVIQDELRDDITNARQEALTAINSDRYLDLHDRLVEATRRPQLHERAASPAADALPPLVKAAWQRLERAATLVAENSSSEQWHKVRLAAKRARYAGEAVTPALGQPAVAYAKQVERLTDVLGEHQDAIDAARRVADIAAGQTGDIAFDLGVIAGTQQAAALAARDEFRRTWPEVKGTLGLWG